MHPLEADPKGLRARLVLRPLDVSPRLATRWTISASRGDFFGGRVRFTAIQTAFHSDGWNTASQSMSGQLRPKRHTNSVRHATIKYSPHSGQDSVDVLETSVLDATARFQSSEQDFNRPPNTIVFHDRPHLLERVETIGRVITGSAPPVPRPLAGSAHEQAQRSRSPAGSLRSGRGGGRSVTLAARTSPSLAGFRGSACEIAFRPLSKFRFRTFGDS